MHQDAHIQNCNGGYEDAVRSLRNELVSRERQDAIIARQWLSAPFEIGSLMDDKLASQVCDIARMSSSHSDSNKLVAVDLDPSSRSVGDMVIELPLSPNPLVYWARDANCYDWLITIPSLDFALICYGIFNYNVIYGPREIVEYVMEATVEVALNTFKKFTERYTYEPDIKYHYEDLNIANDLLKHSQT